MNQTNFESVQHHLSKAGYFFSHSQIMSIQLYIDEIAKWNNKINLTGAKSPEELFDHVLISLSFQKFLDVNHNPTVLDLGSGAGFPGIPLKISCPELPIDFVDSRSKKVGFLKNVCRKLDFKNYNCFLARCEILHTFLPPGFTYNYIVSRAVGNLFGIVKASFDLLALGGRWIVLKGDNPLSGADQLLQYFGGKIEIITTSFPKTRPSEGNYTFLEIKKCST